jgi:phosphotransferase system enzyme I (PtsI)
MPDEEEQYQAYRQVVCEFPNYAVFIRTFDLGGDKFPMFLHMPAEENPFLGWRAIRVCLDRLELFRPQLRAILRATAHGDVRILLPLVNDVEEVVRVRELLSEEEGSLRKAGIPFYSGYKLGCLVETPAAALDAAELARHCDFFSIGTNDLTQYTLAVDRGNEHIAHLFDPLHPAVLNLIDRSVRGAQRAGIPVSVCGEMASNPLAVPILVGLGIGELSATPSAVPIVKEIIHALDQGDAESDARRAREAGTAKEVRVIGAQRLLHAGLVDHPDIGSWLRQIVERELN